MKRTRIFTLLMCGLLLLSLACILIPQAKAQGSGINLVQTMRLTSFDNTVIAGEWAGTPPAGNTLILTSLVYGVSQSYNITSVVESGVSWHQVVQSIYVGGGGYNLNSAIWVGQVSSGASASIQIYFDNSAAFAVVNLVQWSGLSGSIDQTATNGSITTFPDSGTTAATTYPIELCVASLGAYDANLNGTVTNGYTLIDGHPYGTYSISNAYCYLVTSTNGAQNVEETTYYGGAFSGCIATFTQQTAAPLSVTVSTSSLTVPIGQTGTFTATVTGGTGPYTYVWQNIVQQLGTGPTFSITPTSIYSEYISCIVTDSLGNVAYSSGWVTFTSIPAIVATPTPPPVTTSLAPFLWMAIEFGIGAFFIFLGMLFLLKVKSGWVGGVIIWVAGFLLQITAYYHWAILVAVLCETVGFIIILSRGHREVQQNK